MSGTRWDRVDDASPESLQPDFAADGGGILTVKESEALSSSAYLRVVRQRLKLCNAGKEDEWKTGSGHGDGRSRSTSS